MNNEFDAAVASSLQPSQGQAARVGFSVASDSNPDTYAEAQRVARRTGVPVDTALNMPKEVKRQAAIGSIDFDALAKTSPATALLLADVEKAKIAHDDVDNLSSVERTLLGTAGDAYATLIKGAIGLPQAFVGLADIPTFGYVGKGLDAIGIRFNDAQKAAEELFYSDAQKQAAKKVQSARGFTDTLSAAWHNPSVIATTAVESAPQILGGASIARGLLKFLPKASSVMLGAIGEGATGAGSAAESIRSQNVDGTLSFKQSLAAVGSGVGTAAFGLAGGKLAGRLGLDDIDAALVLAGLDKGAAKAAKIGFVSKLAAGGISEGLFEELPQSAQEQMWQNYATGKPLGDGVKNAMAMGLVTGGVMGGGFQGVHHAIAKAQSAEQGTQQLARLNELASASKVLQRDPQSFEAFIEQVSEGGPVQHVFIDANTLMQSGVAEQVAAVSPAVATQLAEAVQTGGQIAIPVGEYTARIAPTEYAQSLLDHLKTDPEGFSRAEAQQYMQSHADELKAEVERALTEKAGDDSFKQSTETVRAEVKAQLDAAARFTPQVNDAYSAMVGNFYATMAAKTGTTPEELFQRYPLKIAAERIDGAGPVLDQGFDGVTRPTTNSNGKPIAHTEEGLRNFWRWFGDSKAVDADGKPLVVYHGTNADFSAFDPSAQGSSGQGSGEPGFFFEASPDNAGRYTRQGGGGGGNVMPVFLSLKNPLIVERANTKYDYDGSYNRVAFANFIDDALEAGHDGVIFRDVLDRGKRSTQYVAFYPEQIKSAIGNRGTFDPSNPNILMQSPLQNGAVALRALANEGNNQAILAQALMDRAGGGAKDVANVLESAALIAESDRLGSIPTLKPVLAQMRSAVLDDQKVLDAIIGSVPVDVVNNLAGSESAAKVLLHNEAMNENGPTFDADLMVSQGIDAAGPAGLLVVEAALSAAKVLRSTLGAAREAGEGRAAMGASEGNGFSQGGTSPRATYNPYTNTITLLKGADLSSFLHESGHFFLEVQTDIAAKLQQEAEIFGMDTLKPGERQILADNAALLRWFGIENLAEWHNLDFEQKRSYHEQFARGFEAYLFEGKAPSIELQGLFQRFRVWLLSVYRELKALNVELTDEVRGVFDRLLATNEQITLAEQGRSMMPLFTSPEQAGMTPEEFAAYQAIGVYATAQAIEDLQARGLRDMRWLHNARGRIIKQLQKDAEAQRAQVRMDVRREVMSQPIYRAWQFLTGKLTADDKIAPVERPKSDPDVVDPALDSLFVAIAKLGGIQRDSAAALWGVKPEDKPKSGVFGKHVLRRTGGLTVDQMAERLAELGYLEPDEHGNTAIRDFEEAFHSELGGSPIYSREADYDALSSMRAGDQVVNPEALGAGRFDMGELKAIGLPVEVVNALKARRMTAANGLHPDIVAEMFGFTSGDELVRKLAVVESPKDEIDALTDQRMLEQHGELSSPEAIREAADRAIHNEFRARFLATEANALAKATGQMKILVSAAKEHAAATIGRLKVRDVRPGQYASAEARAAKAAEKAKTAGDVAKAATEKRNQVLQNCLTKAAYDAKEKIEKAVKYFKQVQKPGKVPAEHHDQILALLSKFELKDRSLKDLDNVQRFRTWAKSQLDNGEIPPNVEMLLTPQQRSTYQNELLARDAEGRLIYESEEDQALLLAELVDASPVRNYKDATVEELMGLQDAVRQIEHIGRRTNRVLTDRKKREFSTLVDEIKSNVVQVAEESGRRSKDVRSSNTSAGRMKELIRGHFFSHVKASAMIEVIDGKQGGPLYEALMASANRAANSETVDIAKVHDDVRALLDTLKEDGKITSGERFYPTIGRSLNRQSVIAMALNMGNDGNIQRLLGGENWTLAQIKPVLDTLTAKDWQVVQGVWDLYEKNRAAWVDTYRELNGASPELVEARALEVETADGQTLTLRGGYAPIVYDPKGSGQAQTQSDEKIGKAMLQAARMASTVQKGFTKPRVEEVRNRPLLLSLDALLNGMQDTIHYVHWAPWIIDANRMIRSLDPTIRAHYGAEAVKCLRDWVADTAIGVHGPRDSAERAVAYMAKNVSFAALSFNFMNAIQQVTGYTSSIVTLGRDQSTSAGYVWMARGLAHVMRNRRAAYTEAVEKSDFMRKRATTMLRDLNETANTIQDQTKLGEFSDRYGYILTQAMQVTVDLPTWWGAYHKALAAQGGALVDEEGRIDDSAAIALADQAVIDSQGGGHRKDLARYERATGAMRLLSGFMSYMNTMLNQNYRVLRGRDSVGRKMHDLLLLNAAPVLLMVLIKEGLTPGGGGGDKKEDLWAKLLKEEISYLFGQFVGLREMSQIVAAFKGETAGTYGGPSGLRVVGDTLKFAKQVGQGEADLPAVKAFMSVLGEVFRLPSVQINRTITGAKALKEGKTHNPAALVFGFQEKR